MVTRKTTGKAAQAKPEAKAAGPSALHDCRCGCGTKVKSTFAPGHDARYASQLRQKVAAGTLTRDAALRLASEVSPAFVSKVTKSLDNLAREQEHQAPKAQPEPDGQAA
jgi:hypothetical protein